MKTYILVELVGNYGKTKHKGKYFDCLKKMKEIERGYIEKLIPSKEEDVIIVKRKGALIWQL